MKLTAWQRFAPLARKAWKIMRITTLLILVFCLHLSAKTSAQKITLSSNNISIEQFFNQLEKQTGYSFLLENGVVSKDEKISVNVKDAALESVLDQVLKPINLSYKIENKTVTVQKIKEVVNQTVEQLPPGEIHGRITNEHGQPLENANVTIKRTKTGTITDANGKFSLKNIKETDEIIVSFIGYKPQTIKVGDQTNFSLVMEVTNNELDKVVIQAYGTTSQRLTTSDIGTVTAAEIERQPIINPLLALQGRVAGLDVNQTNGFASAPIKVELRGRSAISNDFTSDPLYIIDGVPLTVLEIAGTSSYQLGSTGFLQSGLSSPAGGQSPFFSVNPADIESMEVLKDADATAIYGSRGANGVILITTKKGKAGETKFDLHVEEGATEVTRTWAMMNTSQYLAMRREALRNDGITPSLADGDYDLLQWDTTKYTDWQKEIYGHTGKTFDVQASLSGGDAQTTFRVGAGYDHTTNILTVSGADQRGSISLNLNHHSLNQRFNISFINTYTITKSDMISMPDIVTLPPNAPPIYDSSGNLNYAGWGDNNTSARQAYPFASLLQPYTSVTNFLNSNLIVSYLLLKGLKITSNLGYNNAQANTTYYTYISSQDPLSEPTGSSQLGSNNNKNWIIEPQISYEAMIGKSKLTLLAGSTVQETNTNALSVQASGFTNDELIKSIANSPNPASVQNYEGEYHYASVFARATYNWENKYILNFNARRDGSSRFGPDKQFGNFGSIGAAWIFTEEKWLKHGTDFLSFGKLNITYGTTGSDAVGDYQYLTRWSSNGTWPYTGVSSLRPTQAANPDFQWQVNKKFEAKINLGFLHDRIYIGIAYYNDRCGDQLISFPTPALTGFTTVTANSPALVQNAGFEFTGMAKIIKTSRFDWSVNFVGAINQNKLIYYPNLSQSPFASTLVIGQSLNILHLLHYTGVDPQTGQYTFQDKNHDGLITYNPGHTGDDTYTYDLSPSFLGGLGMNLIYSNLQLYMYFNIKKQIGVNAYRQLPFYPGQVGNQPTEIIGKEWQQPGSIASIARYTTQPAGSDGFYQNLSDAVYTDASFIRLSNLAIAYNLPASYLQKVGIHGCSIFIHMNNLFVITKYKGLDPETQNFGGMPPSKTIIGGLSFNF